MKVEVEQTDVFCVIGDINCFKVTFLNKSLFIS